MSKVVLYESVEDHIAPHRAHEDDVGYDLTAYSLTVDKDHEYTTVDLGTRIALPGGYWAQIYARSSLADKGWRLVNSVGIIDSGYRGPLKAKLEKRYASADKLKVGEIYVQLVIYPNPFVSMKAGKVSKDTARGEGGFGSTTKKKAADLDEEVPKKSSKSKKTDEEDAPKKKSSKKTGDDEEAPKKKKSSKKAQSDDEEDAPKKKSSKSKKAQSDDEEDAPKKSSRTKKAPVPSDDEEDAPKKKSSKKTADEDAPKKSSRTKKAPVPSDDEDEPPRSTTKKKTARGRSSADDE